MRLSKRYFGAGLAAVIFLSIYLIYIHSEYKDFFRLERGNGILFQGTGAPDCKRKAYMKDAMADEEIVQFYEEDIQQVELLTNGDITIKSCDVDLNEDGLPDRLVSIISPLHSGSHGDTFHILLNEEGILKKICSITLRLYEQSVDFPLAGEIYILDKQSSGFHDIQIITDENSFILCYEDGGYIWCGLCDDSSQKKK